MSFILVLKSWNELFETLFKMGKFAEEGGIRGLRRSKEGVEGNFLSHNSFRMWTVSVCVWIFSLD